MPHFWQPQPSKTMSYSEIYPKYPSQTLKTLNRARELTKIPETVKSAKNRLEPTKNLFFLDKYIDVLNPAPGFYFGILWYPIQSKIISSFWV